jgi:hypothetical protein
VLQASVLDGLSLNPFSFPQNGLTAPEVNVGRRQVAQALVVAQMIVVRHKRRDLRLQIAGEEVVLQQDAVLECLVSALDLALGHGMVRRPRTWLMPLSSSQEARSDEM